MNVGCDESTRVLYIGGEGGVDFKSATAFRRRICIFEKVLIRVKLSDWWLFVRGLYAIGFYVCDEDCQRGRVVFLL